MYEKGENNKMDMCENALGQAKQAFAECRDEMFSVTILFTEICQYVKNEGLVALCKSEIFRSKGEPHILDVIEKKGIHVQLKDYLLFGFSCISSCDDLEELNLLMKNKYFANSYNGKDLFIGFAYYSFIFQLARGDNLGKILEHFSSFLPDAETEAFELFLATKLKTDEKSTKSMGRIVQFGSRKE